MASIPTKKEVNLPLYDSIFPIFVKRFNNYLSDNNSWNKNERDGLQTVPLVVG